ncbi:MAG TPA: hypothetical protein VG937_23855 [Polyangiaceae bacterium]|nr:hypothetical protein [Polyangiaceae bacterium]
MAAIHSGLSWAALLLVLGCGGNAARSGNTSTGGSASSEGGTAGSSAGGAITGGQNNGGTGGGAQSGCVHDGKSYPVGATFAAGDGCNTCTCERSGAKLLVSCTLIGCNVCPDIESTYNRHFEAAKRCDPALSVEQCTQKVEAGLPCSCTTFVNPQNAVAVAGFQVAAAEYASKQCQPDVACEPCLEPTGARCSAEGHCESFTTVPIACIVGGVRYESGTKNIPDPTSCNTCFCDNGNLGCTTAAVCTKPCPTGTKFGRSCGQCGPVDNCLAVAYDCYPTCTDTCDKGVCSEGICKPGFCG